MYTMAQDATKAALIFPVKRKDPDGGIPNCRGWSIGMKTFPGRIQCTKYRSFPFPFRRSAVLVLRARHTVFDRVRKLEEGGGIFTGLPESSDGVVRTDLSGTLRPDFLVRPAPLLVNLCRSVLYF